MNGSLGHYLVVWDYIGPGTTCSNELSFDMNHALDAGSIVRHVDLQSLIILPRLPSSRNTN